MDSPHLSGVQPAWAIAEARVSVCGSHFPIDGPRLPDVSIGGAPARVVYASSTRLDVVVPAGLSEDRVEVRVDGCAGDPPLLSLARPFATDLHQVDSPVFDRSGNLYLTYSGRRGETVPVSIFCIRPDGAREPFSSGVVNPTSMAVGADGGLYVSSRFEGTVYHLYPDGSAEPFATDLGVPCGLAFAPDGMLYVGDRSGTIFKVDHDGHASAVASLPSSVAAFHLAFGPDGALYVTGPTLSSRDAVYRIDPSGAVTVRSTAFGRPQGLIFDGHGALLVVEALAGASGVYRVPAEGRPEMILSGPGLVGLALDASGGMVVCSNDNAYRAREFAARENPGRRLH